MCGKSFYRWLPIKVNGVCKFQGGGSTALWNKQNVIFKILIFVLYLLFTRVWQFNCQLESVTAHNKQPAIYRPARRAAVKIGSDAKCCCCWRFKYVMLDMIINDKREKDGSTNLYNHYLDINLLWRRSGIYSRKRFVT